MNVRFQSEDCAAERRPQRGVERLRRALQHVGRLLAAIRYPEPLAPLPIRVAQPPDAGEWRRRPRRG